jgi:phospholipase A1
MTNTASKIPVHLLFIKVLLSLWLVSISPITSAAEMFDSKSLLGIGDEDTNFKSYRPSYFGYRLNHSNTDNEGEIKFQLSLKYQISKNDVAESMPMLNTVINNWYFGYTQKSFWSIHESSQPFRESNFSPEFFKEINYSNWESDDIFKLLRLGLFQHESTGEAGAGSHGWNLTYLEPILKYRKLTFAPKFFAPVLFRSKQKAAPDNPDIFDYYGYTELKLIYDQTDKYRHSLMYRQGDNRDLYGFQWQTDIAFHRNNWNPKIFIQYWSGYGESLKDYNHENQGLVIGMSAVY